MSVKKKRTLRNAALWKDWADTDLYMDRLTRYQLSRDSGTQVSELVVITKC